MHVHTEVLTMDRNPTPIPPHFLVVVPGMMGSKLRDRRTGQLVWLDFDSFPLNPFDWDDWVGNLLTEMVYPNENLEPAGIMDRLMFVSPWARQEQYSRLIEALEGIGYRFDPALSEAERNGYAFSYDWRQDIRISGRLLGEAIERWHVLHNGAPAWIIAHSMGGIASRWYIEKEGGKDFVSRLFLIASPWNGAPKAMQSVFRGVDLFLRARFNPMRVRELTQRTIRSFPSAYQILPHQGLYLHDGEGRAFDPYANTTWLENDAQRALLADALLFNKELGNSLSVETLCFFGRKRPTASQGVAMLDGSGLWDGVTWEVEPAGDGTVPETSAVHEAAQQKLPFAADHASIYVHPGVLEVLQWELRDRFLARADAKPPVAPYMLSVTLDREQYLPGQTIQLAATLEGPVSAAAQALLDARPGAITPEELEEVRDGRIHVQLALQDGLPGNPPLPAIPDVVLGILSPGAVAGENTREYTGQVQAPYAEGYYRLLSEVWIDGVRVTDIDLLVVDDGHPGWTIDPVTGQVVARGTA
jgi:hypothetical protein